VNKELQEILDYLNDAVGRQRTVLATVADVQGSSYRLLETFGIRYLIYLETVPTEMNLKTEK
jgi:predicted aconitase